MGRESLSLGTDALGVDATPIFYVGDELQDARLHALQEAMRRADLDALLLIKHDAVRYVTAFYAKGYRPFLEFEYVALVPRSGRPVLGTTLSGEEYRARLRSRVSDVRTIPKLTGWGPALAVLLQEHNLSRSRVGYDLLPNLVDRSLRDALPQLQLVDASGLWTSVTAIKHPLEIDLIKRALAIAQRGTRAAIEAIVPGCSELDLSAIAEFEMRRLGSEMNPFIPVVASGPNAALWERVATERRIATGDMVILDFGCVYKGYTGDFARTTVVGEPTPAQRRLYRTAYLALQEGIIAIRPGVPCQDIDSRMRQVIQEYGMEEYAAQWPFGHQIGYGLHGGPVLGPGVDALIQPNMVINLEPALHTPDQPDVGGVEIEDTVLVTETGCERLTDFPYDERLLA